MVFTDETDTLAPEYDQDQDSCIDYSVRLKDVDGSGIDTIFMSPGAVCTEPDIGAKMGQYILVNDGTGRLYAAMHDEFRAMRTQIAVFLNRNLPAGYRALPAITPEFIAYRTASGTINFLAVVPASTRGVEPPPALSAFVNVPLGINLTTDFRRELTVSSRNGSKRIRTFAGDDTIHRALTDPDCAIDGGLGTDTVVYPGKRADWVLTRTDETVTVSPSTGGGTDTLTNIEKAAFDDQTVALTAL